MQSPKHTSLCGRSEQVISEPQRGENNNQSKETLFHEHLQRLLLYNFLLQAVHSQNFPAVSASEQPKGALGIFVFRAKVVAASRAYTLLTGVIIKNCDTSAA